MFGPIFIFLTVSILLVGFNNCSNDSRFAVSNHVKSQSSQVAGNGTPYGGNTGNGTPYGGIRKGSYFAFSNTQCPQAQREHIDVIKNPNNSLLVTKVYPCSGQVDAVSDSEVSISADGLDVAYQGSAYFHETKTGTIGPGVPNQDVLMNCFASSEYNQDIRTFQIIAYVVSDSRTLTGHRILLEKITFNSDSGKPEVFTMNAVFTTTNNNGGSFIAEHGSLPLTGFLVVDTTTTMGRFNSTAFSAEENVGSGNLRCNKIDSRSLEDWRNI